MIDTLNDLMQEEGVGVFYVREDSTVYGHNDFAKVLLDNSGAISISSGSLIVNDPQKTKEFKHKVKFKASCHGKESLLISSGDSRYPVKLSLFPIQNIVENSVSKTTNLIVVLVKDMSVRPKFMTHDFAGLYKLTDAEIHLANSLYKGLTLKEHSEIRKVKITTTRWTLDNLFSKTFSNSQAELKDLLLSFSD